MVLRLAMPVLLLSASLSCAAAQSTCSPIRIAYLDQHRPPYWLGDGKQVAEPPGAGVELLREAAAEMGCEVSFVRLPSMRILAALAAGEIDFAPVEERPAYPAGVQLPPGADGAPDRDKAVLLQVDVVVRAADTPANTEPRRYFLHHALGVATGAAYTAALRQAGLEVDDGARDVGRNLDKLRLHRLDGVAVSVMQPGDLDAYLSANYPGQFQRLEQPLISSHIWLAASSAYYHQHREQTEAMWNWLGPAHRAHMAEIVKRYARPGQ
jgi:hypothetical protein